MSRDFEDVYRQSLSDPEAFWGAAADAIHWDAPFERVFAPGRGAEGNADHDARHGADYRADYQWFPGGRLNTCYNALDRHVQTDRAKQPALVYESPVTGQSRTYTYRELLAETAVFAGALAAHGVQRGDRVVLYMPMVPETVIAMLACARIGAVHSVVFGGFAPAELAARIEDAQPRLVVAASCGIEPGRIVAYKPLLDEALALARHTPEITVILQREQGRCRIGGGREIEWNDFVAAAAPHPCVPVDAGDPLYILYTSGTTGRPKGVVRDNGGHAVALRWSMPQVYDCQPGEVFWAASDVGWVVGHSYIVYGPLLNGSTTVLYEGKPVGTPDAGAFWCVIADRGVSTLFTAPTAIRAIRQQDPDGDLIGQYDLSRFRALFLAGERCDPDTLEWCEKRLGVPVIDHWWQTETGWPIAANCLGIERLPVKPGSPTKAVPGWDVRVLDPEGARVPPGKQGEIVCRLPLPPGALNTLWGAHDRFVEEYLAPHPGYYKTGDAGMIDEDGYLHVLSRTDDIINVAGHRLSTGVIEEIVASHEDVVECAVVGVSDPLKGQVPAGFLVLRSGSARAREDIEPDVVELVRRRLGPVAAFKTAYVVDRLPKTRSGKILRKTIRRLADGERPPLPPTIEDPAALDEIAGLFRTRS